MKIKKLVRILRNINPKAFYLIAFLFSVHLGALLSGCGYTLQGSRSEYFEKEGISRIYVKPLLNNSFQPGAENIVYNALVKTLSAHKRVKIVQNINDSDAVLQGTVSGAQFTHKTPTPVSSLMPKLPEITIQDPRSVTSIFTASLSCSFNLVRRQAVRGKGTGLWGASFGKARDFPAAAVLDVPGTTSALINQSEFERALIELASNMMEDVHESMLAMF